ncbi:MAG: peptidoglycan-binding protein [Pyrinomonadaceae bacterium]
MKLRRTFLAIVILILGTSAMYAQAPAGAPPSSTTATTTNSAKKPPVFRPTKEQIGEVQTMLKNKKLYNGVSSGTYNDETRTAIKAFQKDNGLKETGTLNRATLEKFGIELTDNQKLIPVSKSSYASSDDKSKASDPSASSASGSAPSTGNPKAKKPAVFRATVDQIKAAQKMLKDKSLYAGTETGKLDDATREALKKYQSANSVRVTGTLNSMTLEKMGIALTEKQKASGAAAASSTPK